MRTLAINSVSARDADRAIGTIVRAFGADPAARWMYPDDGQYAANFPRFVRAFGGKAFASGTAYSIGDQGAALWLPPGVHQDDAALNELIEETVPEENRQDLSAVLEQMDSFHPAEPHWYLPLIGVDPLCQSKGYGSALMAHALRQCDREGKLAYLESSNPQNISLYARCGFELLGTIKVGGLPPISPMLRKPRWDR